MQQLLLFTTTLLWGGATGQLLNLAVGVYPNSSAYNWNSLTTGFCGARIGIKLSQNNPAVNGGGDLYADGYSFGQTYTPSVPVSDINYAYLNGEVYFGISTYTYDGNYTQQCYFEEDPTVYVVDFDKIAHLFNNTITSDDVANVSGAIIHSFSVSSSYINDGVLHALSNIPNIEQSTKIILVTNCIWLGGS